MKNSPLSLSYMVFLLIAAIGFIAGGLILQNLIDVRNTADIRSQAQEADVLPELAIFTEPVNPVEDEEFTINFQINTGDMDIDGVEMRNMTLTDNGANLSDPPSSLQHVAGGLSTIVNSVSDLVSSSANISYLAILSDFNIPFNTNGQMQTFAKLTLLPNNPGEIGLSFDLDDTKVTEFGGDGSNVLISPSNVMINVVQAGDSSGDSGGVGGNNESNAESNNESAETEDECEVPFSPAVISATSGTNPGEIEVSWVRPGGQDYFAVSFGKAPGQYQWGNTNIGNTRSFTIKFLDPGIRYYIAISAVNSCGGSAYSPEVSAVATGNLAAHTGTKQTPQVVVLEALPTPTPTASATPLPTINQTKAENEDKSGGGFIQRLMDNGWLLLVVGLLLGGLISRFFGRKPAPHLKAATKPFENPIPPVNNPIGKSMDETKVNKTTDQTGLPKWEGIEDESLEDIT